MNVWVLSSLQILVVDPVRPHLAVPCIFGFGNKSTTN